MKRPLSVTIISCLFIGAGLVGLAYHLADFHLPHSFQDELIWISVVRVLAVVAGTGMLFGRDWARWLAVLWIAFHVVLSAFHGVGELVMHGVLFLVIALVLFRRPATRYFRQRERRAAGA